jgi:hypothetical protein
MRVQNAANTWVIVGVVGRRGVGLWALAPRLAYDADMLSRLAPVVIGAAVLSGTVAACSLILDTGDLPAIDAVFIDAHPPDANLDASAMGISIVSIDPITIDEGVGTGGGRPAQIYMKTNNLLPNATISVAWADGDTENPPELVGSMLSLPNGGAVGISVRVPELDTLDELPGTDPVTRDITVTITQTDGGGGSYMATETITVKGHDALVVTGNVVTDALDPERVYTSVTLGNTATAAGSSTIRATGTRPLIYNAIGSIVVWWNLDANAAGTSPGAGGCAAGTGGAGSLLGGSPGTAGGCATSGGDGGDADGGLGAGGSPGGGGGFGAAGDGNPPGAGVESGVPMLVPFTPQPSGVHHGNGGGGGGGALLSQNGVAGGGGGGAIGLTAGGTVEVHGSITTNGAPGATTGGSGGDGGGGSGGAIMIRSVAPITAGTLSAVGGTAAGTNAGAPGRIRVDAPQVALTANPPHHPGPAWPTTTPTLVDSASITVRLAGVGCHGMIGATVTSGGCADQADALLAADVTLSLVPGLNRICALWDTTTIATPTQGLREARSCVDVVYVDSPGVD